MVIDNMTQKKTNDQLTQTSFKKIILLDSKTSSTNHFDIDTLDSNEIFIENLSNKIKLSEFEDYLKTI